MKIKTKSLYGQLKQKKLAGTITPEESKQFKKMKKQRLQKKQARSLSIPTSSSPPPSSQSPIKHESESEDMALDNETVKTKKKTKKPKPLDESLLSESASEMESPKKKVKMVSQEISVNKIPARNGENKDDKFKEGFKELMIELDMMTKTYKLQQELLLTKLDTMTKTYKLQQELLFKKFAEEMGIKHEFTIGSTILGQSSILKGKVPKVKRMNSFIVFSQKQEDNLTLSEIKEKWAEVSSADKKLLAKEAKTMNEMNGITVKKAPKRQMQAYTAFTQLQMKENKLNFGQVAELWKTLTETEKAEYQKIADLKNNEILNTVDSSD